MIQGGDPAGNGTGGPGYTIRGEFRMNGFAQNDIKHRRGVLSMARSMLPDSAGSQFFIMHEDSSHLDGQYAAFGKVIEGMEVVDEIASVPTDMRDRPLTPQVIERVTAETYGTEYPDPVRAAADLCRTSPPAFAGGLSLPNKSARLCGRFVSAE